MEIKKNLTSQNFNAGTEARIKYIVIHYTANNGDTAWGNTNYFKQYRSASAHYFVDEENIYQSVEDKNIAWHVGANTYFHKECRNHNSIGIELCSYINGNGKYDFKPKTVDNAVWLTKMLMKKYGVPTDKVIRHYDVTHKICPEPYVRDTAAWNAFKKRLTDDTAETVKVKETEPVETIIIKINGKDYNAARILKNDKNYIAISDLKQAGFVIGYDEKTKIPSITNEPKELHLTVDGTETSVEAVNINGSNYIPIRSLAAATGKFDVDFKDGKVVVTTK